MIRDRTRRIKSGRQGDLGLFLAQAIRRPKSVSALAPSSDQLARAMARQVPDGPGPVIELGPGTGKISRALMAEGVAPTDLHLVEINEQFVQLLRVRHPELTVHHCGAEEIGMLALDEAPRAVVSGLPLLSFPTDLQLAILRAAFRLLLPSAPYIQFTYGPANPVPRQTMQALGLVAERRAQVWGNLPPARIYALHRPAD